MLVRLGEEGKGTDVHGSHQRDDHRCFWVCSVTKTPPTFGKIYSMEPGVVGWQANKGSEAVEQFTTWPWSLHVEIGERSQTSNRQLLEAENLAGFPAPRTTCSNSFYPTSSGMIQRGLSPPGSPCTWAGLAERPLGQQSLLGLCGFCKHFLLHSQKARALPALLAA